MEKSLRKVWKKLGIEIKVEEEDKGKERRGGDMVVRVGTEEKKKMIWRNKWKLKGQRIWIEEDLTWEERRVK